MHRATAPYATAACVSTSAAYADSISILTVRWVNDQACWVEIAGSRKRL